MGNDYCLYDVIAAGIVRCLSEREINDSELVQILNDKTISDFDVLDNERLLEIRASLSNVDYCFI